MNPTPASSALRVLAGNGLPGISDKPITVESLDQLSILADNQRVLPHVYSANRQGLILNTNEQWAADLRNRTMAAAETTLAAHAATIELSRRLTAGGVADMQVLKGCATAHLDYSRPADRFSSDVDILVSDDTLDAVVTELGELPLGATRSARWSRRYGHALTLHGLQGVDVDVHLRIAQGYAGLSIDGAELRNTSSAFEIGGEHLRALDGPNRLLHAALHARSPHIWMHSLRDVPQLVLISGVDWEEAVRRSTAWRTDYFFALGVQTAWRTFDLPTHPLLEWAERHKPRGRQRLVQRIAGTHRRGHVVTAPLALPVRRWPGYTWPLLFPHRDWVEQMDKGWRKRLAILREELRRSSRP